MEKSVITVESDFKIYKENKKIFFKLTEEKLDSVIIMSKHLSLFVNKDNDIIGIVFTIFSELEWEEFYSFLKNNKK